MSQPSYIIGIDLGTTNSTVAYLPIQTDQEKNHIITQAFISQITAAGLQEGAFSLPSFIYYPLPEEKAAKAAAISWDQQRSFCVGRFAKDRGAELPTRVISSAKSWLSHTGIDRRAKILPLESEEESIKPSPLEACTEILGHIRESWNEAMKEPFEQQQILITVPASFDPSARQLVQEAAEMARYPEVVLLEEPQAAFYAWLHAHANSWREQLKIGDVVLVVDIGGGTTDFSLIAIEEEQGNLCLKRKAVGSHLLLGGDNIDLALAYHAKVQLEKAGTEIDHWQLQSLIHQCRDAKEKLLGEDPPKEIEVTVLGRGSRLIANSFKATITQEEVTDLIVNGFMPMVEPEERSPIEKIAGIQQIGLPFVKDPRISCQLAKFLSMTGESETDSMSQFVLPTAVLFNGGTLKSSALRKQILKLLNQWAQKLKKSSVKELQGADYDYAVSQGAAYYGLARLGQAIRIRGGVSRSYFVGIEEAMPAVPGLSPPLKAVCIVPFGMEEGEERHLPNQEFALALGEMATFRFFSRATAKLSDGQEPVAGSEVRNWKKELTELHPIETLMEKQDSEAKLAKVQLKSKVTELGVLELWCVGEEGKKWKLEFDIRHHKQQ